MFKKWLGWIGLGYCAECGSRYVEDPVAVERFELGYGARNLYKCPNGH